MSKQNIKLSLIEMYAIKHSLQSNLSYKKYLIKASSMNVEYINMLKKDVKTEENLLNRVIKKIEQIVTINSM